MRVVVTGAYGRIGRHVVADLLAHDHEVHAFDRVAPPDDLAANGAIWHQGEVRDPDAMAHLLDRARAEALIHLAAIPTPRFGSPLEVSATNTQATFVALEAAGPGRRGPCRDRLEHLRDRASLRLASRLATLRSGRREPPEQLTRRRPGRCIDATATRSWPSGSRTPRRWTSSSPGRPRWRWTRPVSPASCGPTWTSATAPAPSGGRSNMDIPGCHVINVMAPDTYSSEPTAELLARYHPTTEVRRTIEGLEVPFDLTRSRNLLGFSAQYLLPR